jgi:hypothetical protein
MDTSLSWKGVYWTGFIWRRIGTSVGCFEQGDDTLDSVKDAEFLAAEQLLVVPGSYFS